MRGKGVGWLVAVCAVALAACGSTATATPMATVRATNAATQTAAATFTPRPTSTVTASPAPPTVTPTPAPTQPPHGTPEDTKWLELQAEGYRLVTTAMTQGPEGYLYRVYLLTNPAYASMMMTDLGEQGGIETGPGICTLLFYRWDQDHYTLIQAEGEAEEPVFCEAQDWSNEYTLADRVALGLRGEWSDINGNGVPEFAVFKWWCVNCHWWELGNIDFYEIQSPERVANIVADVPGTIVPEKILHSADPLTIWVYDPWLASFETVMAYSVYEWQTDHYVNVSNRYASEYQAELDALVARMKAAISNDSPLAAMDSVLGILVLTNRGGLDRQAGLTAFLDVTDPDNYPVGSAEGRCWLQLTRAHAQTDFENGVPFEPYPFLDISLSGGQPLSEQYPALTRDLDTTKYDVSACLGDQPTP